MTYAIPHSLVRSALETRGLNSRLVSANLRYVTEASEAALWVVTEVDEEGTHNGREVLFPLSEIAA